MLVDFFHYIWRMYTGLFQFTAIRIDIADVLFPVRSGEKHTKYDFPGGRTYMYTDRHRVTRIRSDLIHLSYNIELIEFYVISVRVQYLGKQTQTYRNRPVFCNLYKHHAGDPDLELLMDSVSGRNGLRP